MDSNFNGQVYGFQNVIACQLQEGKGALNRFFCLKGNIILPQGGEFIKGELKAKVSIYDNISRTIFEGEFLDSKRNGKRKETENKYIFEGDYLNDKKWNGIATFDNKVIYELKEGKGLVKECNSYDGKLLFEGNYLNGEENGKGKEYHEEKLIFEGEYLYDHRITGKEYYKSGKLEYEGEYLFDKKWNGKGYDENGNIIYELINGTGKVKEYSNYNGQIYFDGEYLNGKRHGYGKEYHFFTNEFLYEGEYLN